MTDPKSRDELIRRLAELGAEDLDALSAAIEAQRRDLEEKSAPEMSGERSRRRDRGAARAQEEKVAELFALQGARTTVDYKLDDMQFDVRAEITAGLLPAHVLIECKNTDRPVTQEMERAQAGRHPGTKSR